MLLFPFLLLLPTIFASQCTDPLVQLFSESEAVARSLNYSLVFLQPFAHSSQNGISDLRHRKTHHLFTSHIGQIRQAVTILSRLRSHVEILWTSGLRNTYEQILSLIEWHRKLSGLTRYLLETIDLAVKNSLIRKGILNMLENLNQDELALGKTIFNAESGIAQISCRLFSTDHLLQNSYLTENRNQLCSLQKPFLLANEHTGSEIGPLHLQRDGFIVKLAPTLDGEGQEFLELSQGTPPIGDGVMLISENPNRPEIWSLQYKDGNDTVPVEVNNKGLIVLARNETMEETQRLTLRIQLSHCSQDMYVASYELFDQSCEKYLSEFGKIIMMTVFQTTWEMDNFDLCQC